MLVPSRNVIPSWTPRSWAKSSSRSQTPRSDTQVGPADEHLSRPRPGPQVRGDGPPLGSILMPPDDRRDGAPQILRLRLTLGPTRLNQRLQAHPLRVRQHCPLLIPGGAKRPSSQSVQARTGPSAKTPCLPPRSPDLLDAHEGAVRD